MIELPYVNLPDVYTRLLQGNLHHNQKVTSQFELDLKMNKGLELFIKDYFSHIDDQGRISKIIASLGLDNFRNKLGSVFIYRNNEGRFPNSQIPSQLSYILKFEDQLKDYTVSGYSRAFLLATYLFIGNMTSLVDKRILKLLKNNKAKVIKIDWLILTLLHFNEYFDDSELEDLMLAGVGFDDLYEQLLDSQKKQMMNNYLSYGSSIGDNEIFNVGRI